MRLPDLRRTPPGDRGPILRRAALAIVDSLDRIERESCSPGADAAASRGRRIKVRRTLLRNAQALTQRYAIDLPPIVAERADPNRKLPAMINTAPAAFPMWSEDLSDQPHHAAIRDLLRRMIVDQGIPPAEVLEATLGNASALSLEVKGLVGTSLNFYRAGAALAHACPEIQAVAAESLRLTNALAERVVEMGGQRPASIARADH